MVRIECDVWEQRQLFEYLDYSKKKLIQDYEKNEITRAYLEIELGKIKNLEKILNGKGKGDYLLRCSDFRRKYSDDGSLTQAEKELARLPKVR